MATNLMEGLRIENVRNTIKSFNTEDGFQRAFVFIGRTEPWPNDNLPPSPDNSLQEYNQTQNDILSMNRIAVDDAYPMIRRITWSTGVVYDHYNHIINKDNPSYSAAITLYDSNFYVINSERDVYVCLNNNRDKPSTDEPKNTSGIPFFTSDGYQWMFMYNLSPVLSTNYSTPSYIPVIQSDMVRERGEVLTITVDNPGSDYTDMPSGSVNRVRSYYTKVLGDGQGAVARVFVDGTFISKVEVVRFGKEYSYGKINFTVDNVYKSLYDLDNDQNALDPEGLGDFRSTVIISPGSGWRSDLPAQLGATTVGVFTNLAYDLDDFFVNLSFRQIGIIQDPEMSSEMNTVSGTYAVKLIGRTEDNYILGEEIQQQIGDNLAKGTVLSWNEESNVIRYYQDPQIHADSDGNLYRFGDVADVIGQTSGKVDSPDTVFNETISSITFVSGFAIPEYTKNTGLITYLSNLPPIQRKAQQSERLSIMIRF